MTSLSVRNNRRAPIARTFAWDPFDSFRDLWEWDPLRNVERVVQAQPRPQFAPSFDVRERDDAFVLQADMPGVKDEDLELSVIGSQLTVSGSRKAEERTEEESYYVFERSYGDFTRTFALPKQVDTENIEATLSEGVLTIVAPKRAEAQPRKIPLKERIKGKLGAE